MLNQQHLCGRGCGPGRREGVQYNRGPYNYGIKALSANRFRMWKILLCLLLLLLCMPQFEIKREREGDSLATRGRTGAGFVFCGPNRRKRKLCLRKVERKKESLAESGSPPSHLTSPRLVFYGALQHALFATSHSGAKKQLTSPPSSRFYTLPCPCHPIKAQAAGKAHPTCNSN